MSWFDVGALVVTVLAVVDGLTNGLVWAGLETVMLLGSALLARGLAPHAEPYVAKVTALPAQTLPASAHVVVFGLSACSLFCVLLLAHPAAKKWRFENDKWAAAGVGLVNGALASVLVFAMVTSVAGSDAEDEVRASRLLPVVASIVSTPAAVLLPDRVVERVAELGGE